MQKEDFEKTVNNTYLNLLNLLSAKVKEKRATTSIRQLAEISGVSTAVISDLENKKYIPKVECLIRIFYALDISISELLENEPTENIEHRLCQSLPNNKDSQEELVKILENLSYTKSEITEIMNFMDFLMLKNLKKQNKNKSIMFAEKLSQKYKNDNISMANNNAYKISMQLFKKQGKDNSLDFMEKFVEQITKQNIKLTNENCLSLMEQFLEQNINQKMKT